MRRIPQPGVPSIVGGHSRTCVNRCRSRARSRDGFRYGPALGALSPIAPRAPLSRRPWLRCARPPSPRIASIRDFHAERRHALLWVRLPPNDFCNYIPTHGHTHEHPIPASLEAPHYAVAPNALSSSPLFIREQRPSPLEEGSRKPRAATILPTPPPRRCKRAAEYDTESYRPVATPLAGGASTRPPLAAMTVGRQRWTARAEWLRAKDLPSRRLLPQYDVGEDSPPH